METRIEIKASMRYPGVFDDLVKWPSCKIVQRNDTVDHKNPRKMHARSFDDLVIYFRSVLSAGCEERITNEPKSSEATWQQGVEATHLAFP